MSAPERELTLPELLAILPEGVRLDPIELDPSLREAVKGRGRQLASEMLGPYQKPRRMNAKMRRRMKRVAALNHDTTRDVVVKGANRGSVKVNEMPLANDRIEPKWLKRGDRLKDGTKRPVAHFHIVEGPALPGDPFPVRYSTDITDAERLARAERMLRRQAYRMNAGNDPNTLRAVHYWESDADHRGARGRLDVTTASKAQVKRQASQAYGQVCAGCGMNHRGECM